MKNKKSYKLFVIGLILGVVLGVILIISIAYFSYKSDKGINIPSLCYTNLQSSPYFVGVSPSLFTKNNLTERIYIDYKNHQEIFIEQTGNTGSMRPCISDYSILLLIKPSKEEIKIGDVLVMRGKEFNIIHRVVKIEEDEIYVTKGDNNKINDNVNWSFEDVEYKLIGVLY